MKGDGISMKLRRLLSAVTALLLVCSLPVSVFAAEYDLAKGSITVTATAEGQTVTHGDNTAVPDDAPVIIQTNNETSTTNTITIKAEENATANVTIQDVNIVISDDVLTDHSGEAAVTIDVAENAEANVTLDGVNINTKNTGGLSYNPEPGDQVEFDGEAAVQITGNGDVTLELDGENTVQGGFMRAGVEKDDANSSGNLTITDENGTDGSLEATGGSLGAGIGGGNMGDGTNITITGSAEVDATGGDQGAGIGGGNMGSGSAITIEGSAKVDAQGGDEGAGIGGGSGGSGSSITITGSAEVTAKGGDSGSGIGGGSNGNGNGTGSNITVSGDAQVKAQGGNQYTAFGQNYFGAGAAIGNGGELRYGAVSNPGDDVAPNTEGLNEGWIAKYAPGADMDSATPNSVTYKGETGVTTSENVTLVPEKAPTCIEEGHTAGFQCGNDQVGVETRQTVDHSYGGYVSNNDATCTSDGTKTRNCIWCGLPDTVTDPGTKKPHSMGEYYTETPATCQAEGVERRDCENCDFFETSPLKKVDHSYGDFSSDNNATCTSDGTKTRKCIWCDLPDTVTDPGTMKEHSFTNYISDNNATYTSDGTKTAKCDACDATDTIPAPGTRLPFYKVKGQDGAQLRCEEQKQDGVLTIEVDADCASFTGSFSGMKALKARGVDTIVFVTKGATSTFAVEDLLAQGASGDTYSLTHDGEKVTFTLGNGTDIGKILK